MKIRNGFVSNSSSTSFVIAVRESNRCKHCGRKDPDILDLIQQAGSNSYETSCGPIGYDEVITHIFESYGLSTDDVDDPDYDHVKKDVEKIKAYHKKHPKEIIAYADISYHDDTIRNILDSAKNVTVILERG